VDHDTDGWQLATSTGPLKARSVVVATGYNHAPFIPPWPGRERFCGELIHSAEYRNSARFRNRDVLVVGSGNSGPEIAADLAEDRTTRVRLSVRTPPQILPKQALGVPSQALGIIFRRFPTFIVDPIVSGLQRLFVGNLSRYGLPSPTSGAYEQFLRSDTLPTLGLGLVKALKQRRVEVVAAVDGFDGSDVVLADGSRIRPNAVIAATGYRRGLEPLVGHLGVLEATGRPSIHGARTHPAAPRLYFIGFTNPISGNLREIGIDARKIAREISRHHTSHPSRAQRN
jgi:putative flavoprotein involved in K+ transport